MKKLVGAHPRACGEHARSLRNGKNWLGSSPRMRGALREAPCKNLPPGLIPAHAGSTVSSLCSRFLAWAHPRACGEHVKFPTTVIKVSGSSPRMRGARIFAIRAILRQGLIPAHAGSTASLGHCGPNVGAHPRACGEHRRTFTGGHDKQGSSPRMRGAPREHYQP